jgi:large subunit ribosomal protein L25
MANEYTIKLEKRENFGKKAMRQIRKEDKIPGIYYSHASKESLPFMLDTGELYSAVKSEAHLFNIKVGGKSRTVIFKDIQYHPVTDDIMHIDLYGVRMDEAIDFKIPIQLEGIAIGVSEQGGNLSQMVMELDINCLPSDIPDFVSLDVANLELGSSLHVSDIIIPENVQCVTGDDVTVASVTHGIKETEVETTEELDEDDILFDEESDEASEDESEEKSE